MKSINKIVHDSSSYIESIGKADKATVAAALKDQGEGSVLRVCIGAATETMPLRVLGYAASAMMVQTNYFPKAQLQFVHPLHAAEAANGTPTTQTIANAKLFDYARCNIGIKGVGEITGLIDAPSSPQKDLITSVREVLDDNRSIALPLRGAANKRGGDCAGLRSCTSHYA
jgi:hypothetical protein